MVLVEGVSLDDLSDTADISKLPAVHFFRRKTPTKSDEKEDRDASRCMYWEYQAFAFPFVGGIRRKIPMAYTLVVMAGCVVSRSHTGSCRAGVEAMYSVGDHTGYIHSDPRLPFGTI
jgi:hypothetical protein